MAIFNSYFDKTRGYIDITIFLMGKSTNCRLGHFQVRKLLIYRRVNHGKNMKKHPDINIKSI